jgi:hypothetical protein
MDWGIWGRVIAIATGAAVLFGLRQGLGEELYVAIPAGVFVYFVLRGVFAFLSEQPPPS